MTTGNPNQGKLANFVAKVLDPVDQQYKPIYTAPDATDTLYGDVLLSDATDSSLDAASGVTAATPKAVKAVQDNAETKLSKTETIKQTVVGEVEFTNGITAENAGNAATASKLKDVRTITVENGAAQAVTANFDGSSDITLSLGELDATTLTGIVPMSSIPAGALERVHVQEGSLEEAVIAYNIAAEGSKPLPFQEGDILKILEPIDPEIPDGDKQYVMYIVPSDPSNKTNYHIYAAGTSQEAIHAQKADIAKTLDNRPVGDLNHPVYVNNKGEVVATTHILEQDVTLESQLTDTTYRPFNEEEGSEGAPIDSLPGLVPAPESADPADNLFLRSDGSWTEVQSGVTGVKGNNETNYREGMVNLTSDDIGAAGLLVSPPINIPKTYDWNKSLFWSKKRKDSAKDQYYGAGFVSLDPGFYFTNEFTNPAYSSYDLYNFNNKEHFSIRYLLEHTSEIAPNGQYPVTGDLGIQSNYVINNIDVETLASVSEIKCGNIIAYSIDGGPESTPVVGEVLCAGVSKMDNDNPNEIWLSLGFVFNQDAIDMCNDYIFKWNLSEQLVTGALAPLGVYIPEDYIIEFALSRRVYSFGLSQEKDIFDIQQTYGTLDGTTQISGKQQLLGSGVNAANVALLTTSKGFLAGSSNSNLGSAEQPFNEIHVKKINKTINLIGAVQGTIDLFNNEVDTINVNTVAVTGGGVGGTGNEIMISTTEPAADSGVKLWIKV